MTSINFIFGNQEFSIYSHRNDKFRCISAYRTLIADNFNEAVSYVMFDVNQRLMQIREYNVDFPGENVSEFDNPLETVNLDRMMFDKGTYIGDRPYENFEF